MGLETDPQDRPFCLVDAGRGAHGGEGDTAARGLGVVAAAEGVQEEGRSSGQGYTLLSSLPKDCLRGGLWN